MSKLLTRDAYWARWTPEYQMLVLKRARDLGSDGCSWVPDFYAFGCFEHDCAYRTGRDPLGDPIDRQEADRRFRWYMQLYSPFGRVSPMAWWRWALVRWRGGRAWAPWGTAGGGGEH